MTKLLGRSLVLGAAALGLPEMASAGHKGLSGLRIIDERCAAGAERVPIAGAHIRKLPLPE